MAIDFHPKPGQVLICNYEGFIEPEMRKTRRVIVVSGYQLNKQGLCTVVPVSTLPPEPVESHHYRIPRGTYSFFSSDTDCWVKCDMISRVSFARLDRLRVGKEFLTPYISTADLMAVRRAIQATLDI